MTARVRVSRLGEIRLIARELRGHEREVLDGLGALAAARAQRAFRLQRGRKPWAPRMTPNVPGIVRDLNLGREPSPRRWRGRPALVDTGRLRSSITWRVGAREVVVGTNLPYAATQNEGGISTVQLDPFGVATLAQKIRRNRRLKPLGWLFRRPRFAVRVRKRAFLFVDRELRRELQEFVEAEAARIAQEVL